MSPRTTSRPSSAPAGFEPGDFAFISDYLDRWADEVPDSPAVTFVDYFASREGLRDTITFVQLQQWARAVAVRIGALTRPGDRVAFLLPQGIEYVVGFTGCLHTTAVGVPLFAPDLPGHADRLAAVSLDAAPSLVLTTSDKRALVDGFLAEHGITAEVLNVDELRHGNEELAASYTRPDGHELDDVAYLQYTSGSTRTPAGVVLTHRNLIANALQLKEGTDSSFKELTIVSWLPLFHDMGLLLGAAIPVFGAAHSVLIDPVAFILKPLRWLQAVSGHEKAVTAAPNFAFDYVAKRVKPEQRAGLDLSGVRTWVNGAEPILPSTLERFQEAFGPVGARPDAMRPSYGLAEATVFVACSPHHEAPTILQVDGEEMSHGTITTEVAEGVTPVQLVSCGTPVGQHVAIVDPDTRMRLPDGQIGEIWLNGENVGGGLWNKPEETKALFDVELLEHAELPSRGWLRTEDLGVFVDGNLYITGRIKDIIIIDGRNIYPHDVEFTVEESHDAIAQRRLASFSIATDHGEALVVVAERYRHNPDAGADLEAIVSAAREAVSLDHSLALHDFVLVEPDTIPRTSSGKIARKATREAYVAGTLSTTPILG
ncbi:MAG: fatty acyl-AMP ligase [Patulibacter minatonensis]